MSDSTPRPGMARLFFWLWMVLALVIAAKFVIEAAKKLTGEPAALEPFEEFGWPLWLAAVTAAAEIVGGLALIIPLTRTVGGLLLTAVMIAAAVTNLANGHPDYVWLNAVLIAGSLLLAWQGRKYVLPYLPSPRERSRTRAPD